MTYIVEYISTRWFRGKRRTFDNRSDAEFFARYQRLIKGVESVHIREITKR